MQERETKQAATDRPRVVYGLKVQNMMKVRMAEIHPDGAPVVVIGGENGQGKTSIIRSVFAPLLGKKALPVEPIRRGEEKGETFIDFGDIQVTYTVTKKDAYLKVKAPDMGTLTPREYIERLVGKMSGVRPFDIQAFVDMAEHPTPESRRGLVKLLLETYGTGYDFEAAETRKAELFHERKVVNKDLERMEGKLALTKAGEVPGEEIPLDELMKRLQNATAMAATRAEGERALQNLKHNREVNEADVVRLREKIAGLKAEIVKAEHELEKCGMEITRIGTQVEKTEAWLEQHPPVDLEGVRQEIAKAEGHNRMVRAMIDTNREYAALQDGIAEKRAESSKLTELIRAVDKEKEDAVACMKLPAGLGFNENGAVLDTIPLEQAGESNIIRVGIEIALARIPENGFRLCYFRDWASLGKKKRQLVAEFVEKMRAQVWAQIVRDEPDGTCLFIQDGVLFDEGEKNGGGKQMELAGAGKEGCHVQRA